MVPGVLYLMEKWLQHKKSDISPPYEATINNKCSKAVPPSMCHCYKHKKTSPLSLLAVYM